MQVVIMRHGATLANERREYAGKTDVPLSALGEQQALLAGECPGIERVYVSTLQRAQRTAELCFPNAEQVVVDGLQEMDFGDFEGRSADDMENDPAYRAWVDSMCEDRCPNGETRQELTQRVAAAVEWVVADARAHGLATAVIVGHGGTLMGAMHALADAARGYFTWHVGNCEGYCSQVCETSPHLQFETWERFKNLKFLQQEQGVRSAAELPAHAFFTNRNCTYFPCHEGIAPEEFNCLFCYCPLYALGENCGGNYTYTEKGNKNCKNCALPHIRDYGTRLVLKRFPDISNLARRDPKG